MSEAPKRWWLHASLLAPVIVLTGAVAMQAMGGMREVAQPRGPHLAQAVPADLTGWMEKDIPLGANEFMNNEVEKILNYDEFVNREYRRGSQSFGVYVAYWGAGKMPTRLVASHTPDRCWTENGWRCLDMKFKQTRKVDGLPLQPAEWRSFEPASGAKPTYVLYWHLVEGRVYEYGKRFNTVPDPVLWWKDAVQQALLGSREQYFIRLTSTEPLENLWEDPGFAEVVRGLGRLGLLASSPSFAKK